MKFSNDLILSLLLLLWNKYGMTTGKAIIGETIRHAEQGEFDYTVSIMRKEPGNPHSGGQHFCTGVLITRKDVLTAAHCVDDEALNETQIVVGTIDLRDGAVFHPFWWITFDQWNAAHNITIEYNWNDIANIRITEKVSRNISPVKLSRVQRANLFNTQCTIAGWGVTNDGNIPNIMNSATVQVIENTLCENKIEIIVGERIPVNPQVFCSVNTPFVLLEYGDSGGPLIYRNKLIAINQGTCPITNGTYQNQVNLHFGIYYYRPFVSAMKDHD